MNNEIVIINQDSGYLMIDLANAYNRAGYKVTLVAGRLVQPVTAPKPLTDKPGVWLRREILRVWQQP